MTSLAPSLGDAAVLVLAADHEAGDVLQEHQRDAALVAQLDEVRALERRLAEQDAVVGDDADLVAPDPGEAADQGLAVQLLELVEPAAVDDPADHLAHVVRRAGVGRAPRRRGSRGPRAAPRRSLTGSSDGAGPARGSVSTIERTIASACGVVVGEVVDDAGRAGVHVAAAELLGGDDLAGRGLHQRRAAEEDRALVADDHGLVATSPARRRRRRCTSPSRLAICGMPCGGQVGLVEEDPAEVLAVGEHLVLHRQERAAGVDEVDARQPVRRRRPSCARRCFLTVIG